MDQVKVISKLKYKFFKKAFLKSNCKELFNMSTHMTSIFGQKMEENQEKKKTFFWCPTARAGADFFEATVRCADNNNNNSCCPHIVRVRLQPRSQLFKKVRNLNIGHILSKWATLQTMRYYCRAGNTSILILRCTLDRHKLLQNNC